MAYGVRYDPFRETECVAEAIRRAGPSDLGYLFRFEDHSYASRIDPYSDWDDNWTSTTYLELNAYAIKKRTPAGWTLGWFSGCRSKWVGERHRKQFAHPTIEAALESFVARKDKQARIYEARARRAREMIIKARERPIDWAAEIIPSKGVLFRSKG